MKPLHDGVLVELDLSENISRGGIIIPDIAKERTTHFGTVVATGVEVKNVAIGDRVILANFAGHEIEIIGIKHTIVKEEDILGKEI